MKYFKNFIIFTLVIMVLVYNATFAYASQNYLMKNTVSKSTSMVAKNKPMNKAKPKMAKTIQVKITGFAFNLKNITINKGDTVVWTNLDAMAHTVTGSNFDSGNLNTNATFKYTFKTSGTFNYVCTYHPRMTGVVIVK
jgi:plastocyanin